MGRRKYRPSERAVSLLIERYDSRSETIDRLSLELGVPRYVVKRWAQALGLVRTKERLWSKTEVEYLEAHYHRLSTAVLARKLKRSVTAVALKAKRLGIRKLSEGYTAGSLALALGVDAHKVTGWINSGMLRASRRQTERERDPYLIKDEDVRAFIAGHPLEVDLRRADRVWLIDLLANGGKP